MRVGLRYFGEGPGRDLAESKDVKNILITVDGTGLVALEQGPHLELSEFDKLLEKAIAVAEGVGLESYMITVKWKDYSEIAGVPMSDPDKPVTLVVDLVDADEVAIYELHVDFE